MTPRPRWGFVDFGDKDRLILDVLNIQSLGGRERGGNESRPNR
jgi:hypothetical protein